MILSGVKMMGNNTPVNIKIDQGKIAAISATNSFDESNDREISFNNASVFPGLINSHDHLDFNLFPQLGDRFYNNYTEWGKHIHEVYKNEIAEITAIPVSLRAEWGMYKNLLCGVTTVVNHGEPARIADSLISIVENTHCLHSVQFEKNWKRKLNNPFKIKQPVNIHVGEGGDQLSQHEIDDLLKWNLFKRKLIGVHAVAMTERQAAKFAAIVWCPESNYFLLNKTAPLNRLKAYTEILFGTDSTLTGGWNIWEHLQLARKTRLVSDARLYYALNKNAAKTWQLNTGEIAAGNDADIIVSNINAGKRNFDDFFSTDTTDLLLVLHKGEVRLFDESLVSQMDAAELDGFSKIYIDNCCKYVKGDLPALIKKIKSVSPRRAIPGKFSPACTRMNKLEKARLKLLRETKYLGRDVANKLGLMNSFYQNARGNRIMIYHGVCQQDHTRFNPIFLTVDTFEEHLKFYKKYFNVISLDDYYSSNFSSDRFNICLTFDDGFANNYTHVLPLLEKYELPATFFITAIRAAGYDILWNDFLNIIGKCGLTEMVYDGKDYIRNKFNKYINKKSGLSLADELRITGFAAKDVAMKTLYQLAPFKDNKADEEYWLQMTKEQIKALATSPYAAIGSHGYYHNDLARIYLKDAEEELILSKRYLENIIGKPVDSFAFPYGSYTPDVVAAAKKAGYTQLLAMDFYADSDKKDGTMRERFTVNPYISTNNQMHATVKRKYER